MANATPVNKPTPKKTIKPVPTDDTLSLEEQVAALKAQLKEATEVNAELVGGNNSGHKSVVKVRTELPDGTVKVDY